jgi:hypothetical protein
MIYGTGIQLLPGRVYLRRDRGGLWVELSTPSVQVGHTLSREEAEHLALALLEWSRTGRLVLCPERLPEQGEE